MHELLAVELELEGPCAFLDLWTNETAAVGDALTFQVRRHGAAAFLLRETDTDKNGGTL